MSPFTWFLSGFGCVVILVALVAYGLGVPIGPLALGVGALMGVGALVGWLRERRHRAA